jgi:hypothetical protein
MALSVNGRPIDYPVVALIAKPMQFAAASLKRLL